jgi:sugar phosphate isomerase/epimerase
MKSDSAGTLAAIARIGYTEVEFATLFGHSAAELRSMLDRNGLRAVAGHVDIAEIRTDWPKLAADAHTLGWKWIICPWIDQADRTPDGYRRLAAEFNRAGAAARSEGLRFGYHNHDFEFKPFADGSLPYDLLLAELDPALVDLELDLYWIAKGGRDPLQYFERFPGRFPLLHVKDMTASGGMTNVGSGTIDFAKIFAESGRAGTGHFLVEHDEPRNPIADITTSFNYLKALRF